jgi:hypothetical protein
VSSILMHLWMTKSIVSFCLFSLSAFGIILQLADIHILGCEVNSSLQFKINIYVELDKDVTFKRVVKCNDMFPKSAAASIHYMWYGFRLVNKLVKQGVAHNHCCENMYYITCCRDSWWQIHLDLRIGYVDCCVLWLMQLHSNCMTCVRQGILSGKKYLKFILFLVSEVLWAMLYCFLSLHNCNFIFGCCPGFHNRK